MMTTIKHVDSLNLDDLLNIEHPFFAGSHADSLLGHQLKCGKVFMVHQFDQPFSPIVRREGAGEAGRWVVTLDSNYTAAKWSLESRIDDLTTMYGYGGAHYRTPQADKAMGKTPEPVNPPAACINGVRLD